MIYVLVSEICLQKELKLKPNFTIMLFITKKFSITYKKTFPNFSTVTKVARSP